MFFFIENGFEKKNHQIEHQIQMIFTFHCDWLYSTLWTYNYLRDFIRKLICIQSMIYTVFNKQCLLNIFKSVDFDIFCTINRKLYLTFKYRFVDKGKVQYGVDSSLDYKMFELIRWNGSINSGFNQLKMVGVPKRKDNFIRFLTVGS